MGKAQILRGDAIPCDAIENWLCNINISNVLDKTLGRILWQRMTSRGKFQSRVINKVTGIMLRPSKHSVILTLNDTLYLHFVAMIN